MPAESGEIEVEVTQIPVSVTGRFPYIGKTRLGIRRKGANRKVVVEQPESLAWPIERVTMRRAGTPVELVVDQESEPLGYVLFPQQELVGVMTHIKDAYPQESLRGAVIQHVSARILEGGFANGANPAVFPKGGLLEVELDLVLNLNFGNRGVEHQESAFGALYFPPTNAPQGFAEARGPGGLGGWTKDGMSVAAADRRWQKSS
jgi:hypothetical protein